MTTKRIRAVRRLPALVVALTLVAAACGDDDDGGGAASDDSAAQPAGDTVATPGGTGAAAADDVEVDRSQEFIFAHSFGAQNLDPHRSPSPKGPSAWMRPVYDRLLTLVRGPEGVEVGPQLATSWEFSDDGESLEFELRDDVTFHDGTKFNADAVKANIERAMGPDSSVASQLSAVESVEVVDDTHVTFHLSDPAPALPYSLAADTIGMMVSPTAFDSSLASEPVGSGPWRLVSFQPDSEAVYERWDEHWDEDAALVERLTIITVPDLNARYNGVQSGEYDAAFMSNPLDAESQVLEEDGYHWVREDGPIAIGMFTNTDMAPFDDVRVRRAVSMAIDRSAISEELLGGLFPPQYQPFADGYVGHVAELEQDPYDPEAARALIEEAGADGASFTLLTQAVPPFDQIAQVAQQALGEIGLDVEVEAVNPSVGASTWLEGGHAAYVGSILGEPEPSLTLKLSYLGSHNVAGPPSYLTDMATAALGEKPGSTAQAEAYETISRELVEAPIHIPFVQFTNVALARPEVVNADDLVKVIIGNLDFRGIGIAAP